MNIQKTSEVNFGATRILSVSKGQAVTDVYRLNLNNINDVSFVKRCRAALACKTKTAKPGMKDFLQSFLKSYLPCYEGNYYIGIKNDETTTGGLRAIPNRHNECVYTGVGFTNDYSKLSTDCLIYSLLSEAQKLSPRANIIDNMGNTAIMKRYNDTMLIPSENIDGIKKQIETKYPEYVFDTSNEEVNLERIMGINHFENRVLLYQL